MMLAWDGSPAHSVSGPAQPRTWFLTLFFLSVGAVEAFAPAAVPGRSVLCCRGMESMGGAPMDLSAPRVLVALTWGCWQQEPGQEDVTQLRC